MVQKYTLEEAEEAIKSFVVNGFVLMKDLHDEKVVEQTKAYIVELFQKLSELEKNGEIKYDVNGWAVAIIKRFESTALHKELMQSSKLLKYLKQLLGPDISLLGQDALWINHPIDKDPVLNKGIHSDAWTGTSVNTIFSKYFVTDCDDYNGMSVVPGSHLWGFVPVRNRSVDPNARIDEHLKTLNIKNAQSGDTLLWHALLLHSTTGHSDVNTRISITSRYTSTETEFSSQERSLGYTPLSVGPMNQILRIIGNDLLSPFRTLGGYVGVDRRLQHLYGYSDYRSDVDYSIYI